jgi:hypothetical protein
MDQMHQLLFIISSLKRLPLENANTTADCFSKTSSYLSLWDKNHELWQVEARARTALQAVDNLHSPEK